MLVVSCSRTFSCANSHHRCAQPWPTPLAWPRVTTGVWLRKRIVSCWLPDGSPCRACRRTPGSRQRRARTQQWWLEFPGGDSAEAPCVFSTSVMAPRLCVASLRARLRCRETPEPALSSSCERWRARGAAVFEGLPVRQAFPGGLRLPEVPASSGWLGPVSPR